MRHLSLILASDQAADITTNTIDVQHVMDAYHDALIMHDGQVRARGMAASGRYSPMKKEAQHRAP